MLFCVMEIYSSLKIKQCVNGNLLYLRPKPLNIGVFYVYFISSLTECYIYGAFNCIC